MQRLTLQEALDVAGRLYDELREVVKHTSEADTNFSVFRELSLRRIVLDKLGLEMAHRNVLPVTLNTLSNLFSQVYTRIL